MKTSPKTSLKALRFALPLLLVGTIAHAEEFKCTFTEPFVTVTYSTSARELSVKDSIDQASTLTKNVSFQIAPEGKFLLKNAKGNQLLEISIDAEGSDGMSDRVFPFTAKVRGELKGLPTGATGGCESTLMKSHNPSVE